MNPQTQAIRKIAERLYANGGRSIVGVAGLGGTGKSTVCRDLVASVNFSCCLFEIDWYLIHSSSDRRRLVLEAIEGKDPAEIMKWRDPTSWYDWDQITAALSEIRSTGRLKASRLWRQSTGEKDLSVDINIDSPGIIFCDGIYLLHEPISSFLDSVVVLNSSTTDSLKRSAQRDAHRNPEAYQHFKAEITKSFDIPYFIKYGTTADEIVAI